MCLQLGGFAFIGEGIPIGLGAAYKIKYKRVRCCFALCHMQANTSIFLMFVLQVNSHAHLALDSISSIAGFTAARRVCTADNGNFAQCSIIHSA